MNDIFNGQQYVRMRLTPELIDKGILDICINKDPRQISICYQHEGQQMKPLIIPVLEFPYPTVDQLDGLVNSSMSLETLTELKASIVKKYPRWNEIYNTDNNDTEKPEREKIKKVQVALDISKRHISQLFVDEYKTAYAGIRIHDSMQLFPINSKSFKNWLRNIIYQENGTILNSQTLNDICDFLSGNAEFEGEEIPLSLRTASTINNNQLEWIYDLTNKDWEFVKITSEGWYIFKNSIVFRRYNTQRSQVYPSKEYGPDIFDRFMKLVNVKQGDEETKLLLKCYIISLFIPDIQKVILMLHGAGGSAKTFLEELIKTVVDPSVIKSLTFPRDLNELLQQLSHNQVVYYDNISEIPDWISDQLCRAVTGSGSSKRALYTDDDDFIRSFIRCVGFNGINLAATKADLLDRGLIVKLERILRNKQRKPGELWKEFEEIRPQLLGYIFDTLVKVLKWKNNGPALNLDGLPRMSEFAEYGEMIARVMGYEENKFIDAYTKNIENQSEEVLESSLVAICLRYMMFEKYADLYNVGQDYNEEYQEAWSGTPTALLEELEAVASLVKVNLKAKYWPKMAHIMSRRLKDIETNLKEFGIEIEWDHDKDKRRIIRIRKIASIASIASETKNQAQKEGKNGDTTGDANQES